MTLDTIPQTVLFPDLFDKPLHAQFNQEQASSDGGAVLLKAAERVYGLVKAFARCLFDKRAPDKTRHSLADLIGQRVFGIACGHPDCNDGDRLADDGVGALRRAGHAGGAGADHVRRPELKEIALAKQLGPVARDPVRMQGILSFINSELDDTSSAEVNDAQEQSRPRAGGASGPGGSREVPGTDADPTESTFTAGPRAIGKSTPS